MMGNVIIEVAEAVGEKRGAERREEEILRNLVSEGLDSPAIIKATGVSEERLQAIRESIRKES